MPTKSHSLHRAPGPPVRATRRSPSRRRRRVLGVHPNTVRAWSEAGRLRYYRINDRGDRRYRLGDLQRFLAAAESPGPTDAVRSSRRARRPPRCAAPTPTLTETAAGLDLLADLAEVASFPAGSIPSLDEACRRIRLATGAALVGIWERRPGGLVPRAIDVEGPGDHRVRERAGRAARLFDARPRVARADPRPARATRHATPLLGMGTDELVVRDPGRRGAVGRARPRRRDAARPGRRHQARRRAIARTLGVLVRGASATEQATSRLRRSEALRRVATDLASRLDVADVVRDLSDHARVLFGCGPGRGDPARRRGPDLVARRLRLLRGVPRHRPGARGTRTGQPRDPAPPAGPRCSARTRRARRARSARPRSRRASTALLVGAARRRPRAPRRRVPRPRPAAPLARGRPRRRRGARRRRRDRRPLGADVRADGGLGGAAPVDPAARRAPRGHLRRARDRPRRSPPSCAS